MFLVQLQRSPASALPLGGQGGCSISVALPSKRPGRPWCGALFWGICMGSNSFLQVGRCMPIYACMGEYKDFVVNPERDREPVSVVSVILVLCAHISGPSSGSWQRCFGCIA